MEADDLLCSRNARPRKVLVGRAQWEPNLARPQGRDGRMEVARCAQSQKVRRKDVRSFLCSRSARPQKGLARRPQSKAPHALAWLSIELGIEY